MKTRDIRCPKCNGVVNKMWLVGLSQNIQYAIFIVECWSGELTKRSYHHIFKVRIPLLEGEPYNFDEKLAHEIEKILPQNFDSQKYRHITQFLEEQNIEILGEISSGKEKDLP